MEKRQKIAVIGLGSMGYGVAQSCLRAGHETYGIDVVPERVDQFQEEGGADGNLIEVAGSLDTVIVVVLNAAQTEEVLFGKDGVVSDLKAGATVIGCATVPPEFAIQMEKRCAALDIHYLDAPISGGAVKAAEGALSIMAAGRPQAFDAAKFALDAISETVFRLGDRAGPGSAMKAVNQLLAGVHIAAMTEALTFGMTQGITPAKFLEVIPHCAGTSWMLENRAPHIVEGDYGPKSQINIWPKDLGIVLEIARSAGFQAPITEAALAQYRAAADMGLGHEDDAAIAKVYAKQAG
ncbi:MAG: L-threonate dehydrogenase, partial [Pseudomonadota bacterium]